MLPAAPRAGSDLCSDHPAHPGQEQRSAHGSRCPTPSTAGEEAFCGLVLGQALSDCADRSKFIRDRKALTKEQIIHLDRCGIPNYQWSALDVNSRFKLMAYSRERSWTNSLCWYLYVISWLRSHGVQAQIVFTFDHGEEFGGQSWLKVAERRKLIRGFGCRLIQNHKGHCEENAHVERSHRTDDDEFYIPRVTHIQNEQDLPDEAMGYVYYCNNIRDHPALGYETPFANLKRQMPDLDDSIHAPIPALLDKVAV